MDLVQTSCWTVGCVAYYNTAASLKFQACQLLPCSKFQPCQQELLVVGHFICASHLTAAGAHVQTMVPVRTNKECGKPSLECLYRELAMTFLLKGAILVKIFVPVRFVVFLPHLFVFQFCISWSRRLGPLGHHDSAPVFSEKNASTEMDKGFSCPFSPII